MRRVPLWLKIGWTAWLVVWVPAYWRHYGPQNFLWFCDVGNFMIAAALWLESRLIFSWQSVSLIAVQAVFTLDMTWRFVTGLRLMGASDFMFDPSLPLWLRLLSLFHAAALAVLCWAVWRFGYDRRGFALQTATAGVVLPVSWLFPPAYDLNWVHGPFYGPQTAVAPAVYLLACMIGYPLLLYLPSHLVLCRLPKRD